MKKLSLLICLLLFLSGCSDYKEVNEMAIVSAIGIDYANDNFLVTLETFNNKVDKQSGKVTTYVRTGEDPSISLAFEKAADKLSARAYYSHVKLCILSEEVAKNYLDQIADFFIRSTYLRENFRVVVSKKSPKEILEIESPETPISSIAINLLLQTNAYASNYAVDVPFDVFLSDVIEFGKDGAMSVINEENKSFFIDGLAIFNEYKMINILDNDEAVIYNLLQGEIKKPVFKLKVDDSFVSVAIYDITPQIKVTKEEIEISGNYKAKIIENTPNLDIKKEEVLKKLDKLFSNLLNEEITNFIQKLQDNKTDIIYLANSYYQKTRDKNDSIWQYAKVNSQVNVIINKKGLVFNIYENNG